MNLSLLFIQALGLWTYVLFSKGHLFVNKHWGLLTNVNAHPCQCCLSCDRSQRELYNTTWRKKAGLSFIEISHYSAINNLSCAFKRKALASRDRQYRTEQDFSGISSCYLSLVKTPTDTGEFFLHETSFLQRPRRVNVYEDLHLSTAQRIPAWGFLIKYATFVKTIKLSSFQQPQFVISI